MFNYEIIFPPPEQLELRRQQLDTAGFHAWLSPIILLGILWFWRTLLHPKSTVSHVKPATSYKILWRCMRWVLNDVYVEEFGPLHVQLVAAAYLSWLLFLTFRNTRYDYLHLTKAFGHVAVSQLPLQYLLAFKSPLSPITIATGLTHERLNDYHRTFGRIVHALLGTHAILYLRFFIGKALLAKRIQHVDVRLGIAAFGLFNILGLLALPVVRRRAYHKAFYRSHILISAVIPVALFFHVPYTRRYVLQAGILWISNGFARAFGSEETTIRCENNEGTQLIKISVDFKKSMFAREWVPGQHIYLRRGFLGPRTPFTVVDCAEDGKMFLVVRNLGGPQTKFLNEHANPRSSTIMALEGPYGEAAAYLPHRLKQLSNAGQIVLIAGGIGATYTLPVYLALIAARASTANVKMLWFVKSLADASWSYHFIHRANTAVDIAIYVTGHREDRTESSELDGNQGVKTFVLGSRPEFESIFDPIIATKTDRERNGMLVTNNKRDPRKIRRNKEKIAFFVCGPRTLSQGVRAYVRTHITAHGREIDFFEEQFGLGGS
jgi:NAD(P)H-flavin reductase